ncbi:MAG: Rieske (2Fe-2S) protein [bacterium]|nr:Rieske (2Fe-2S) protein [bacterium]
MPNQIKKQSDAEHSTESLNWIHEQFDSDPLIQDFIEEEGVVGDAVNSQVEDPFSTFAFETASIAIERQTSQLAPWQISPPPPDGFFETVALDSIPIGKGVGMQVYNRKVAIFRLFDGTVKATDDVCPHAGAPLSNGIIDGCQLMCVWHGWTFDLRTGICDVNEHTILGFYPIEIREGMIFVGILAEQPTVPTHHLIPRQ